MELKKQVVSIRLAKKLKKLGVKQESLFYWEMDFFKKGRIKGRIATQEKACIGSEVCFSAFTVAELGEMLPKSYHSEKMNLMWGIFGCGGICQEIYEKKEADARAKMLIYLIENNLIKE